MRPELIPRSVLFGNAARAMPRISPDGRQLAYLAPVDGVLNVWVGSLHGHDSRPVTEDRDRGIRVFLWADDNRHLLYIQDRGGDENWHLYATDVVAGGTRDLTPFDGVQAHIVAKDRRHPEWVVIGLNRRTPELHDAYRVHLPTGDLTLAAENPGSFVTWVADRELQVRGALQSLPDGGLAVHIRDTEAAPWTAIFEVGLEDRTTTHPISFTADGTSLLLVSSRNANSGRLLRLELHGRAEEVLFQDPIYDVVAGDVVIAGDSREAQLLTVVRERSELVVLDPMLMDDVEHVRALHPGDVALASRNHADRTWVVAFTSDNSPVSYFVYERTSGASRFLFSERPELEGAHLARMEQFSFNARDGLHIHGYLTFPPGLERRGLPAVLNVRGGHTWGFDSEAQWLANRGYLCVQVNFRGSTGYGKRFQSAGDREWGGKMQDDLVDAVRWVIDRGYADPNRIAIYGASYGGYAALAGAAFTPALFRCAVDVVGPSDLRTLLASIPAYWKPMVAVWHARLGNPETEADFLWSRSPLSKADQIRIPLLIAHGANDPRVKQAESERILAALREKGIPYEYLLFPDEGHGFAKPENRLRFYAVAEQFLARHLGGRCE